MFLNQKNVSVLLFNSSSAKIDTKIDTKKDDYCKWLSGFIHFVQCEMKSTKGDCCRQNVTSEVTCFILACGVYIVFVDGSISCMVTPEKGGVWDVQRSAGK